MDVTDLSIVDAARLLQKREISPVELTCSFLARIQRLDPGLNCYLSLTEDLALAQAQCAENEILQGDWRGPLHGIPLGLKDLYETQGIRTTAGSLFFADYYPESNARVVEKLFTAGAILLGKHNMHEIALGVTNVNPHYGATCNPWLPERITGGSSGGSAAAIAARLCLGAFGSDTGGSIRIPAALCGVVGLKPTRGRVSLRGVIPLSWNMDHAGPLARCVLDAAILLKETAGFDAEDPASADVRVYDFLENIGAGVRDWRIAMLSGEAVSFCDAVVIDALQSAAVMLEQLGARITPVDLPQLRQMAQANGLMTISDGAAYHRQRVSDHPEQFGADVRERLQAGVSASAADYSQARRTQTMMKRWLATFFEEYDLLMLPTTPLTATFIEGCNSVEQARRLTRFTAPFNMTGFPAISLPCGFTSEGLPIGLQLVAPPWQEAKLLRGAYAYEQATDWHNRRPPQIT